MGANLSPLFWLGPSDRDPSPSRGVAGTLSGTSADGIDVALARMDLAPGLVGPPALVAFETVPFESELRGRLRRALDGGAMDLRATALLHRDLGRAFGEAVGRVAGDHNFRVDLVGSHGQTLWHHDGDPTCGPASLQLGDGDFVAAAAGAPTVSDFRQGEIAAGGEGAPISVYADDLVFHAAPQPLTVLNLGGMANLSWLNGDEVVAFDTGPSGALLDGLARRFLGEPMDRGGAVAAQGRVNPRLVDDFLDHPFLHAPLPRSTGRDTFGEPFVAEFAAAAQALAVDVAGTLASAAEWVARSVSMAVAEHLPAAPRAVWVAGGGVHHRPLMRALTRLTGVPCSSSAEIGVNPDAREALVFAVLAARLAAGIPARWSATGPPKSCWMGKWSFGSGLFSR